MLSRTKQDIFAVDKVAKDFLYRRAVLKFLRLSLDEKFLILSLNQITYNRNY